MLLLKIRQLLHFLTAGSRDDENDAAPKPWVSSFLGEDRLPYKEGFLKQEKVKTSERLGDMVNAVIAVPV